MIGLRLLTVLTIVFLTTMTLAVALPSGATLGNALRSERAPAGTAGQDEAQDGNVTEFDVTGLSVTQSWQGYFGNVSGTITLSDSSGDVLYNWSLASPQGEIYAANDTVTWTNIQCFNFTSTGLYDCDQTATAGSTSFCGKNLSLLEGEFGIASGDNDGVDETFNLTSLSEGTDQHDQFYTNSLLFGAGECLMTNVFADSGLGEVNQFQEVLLWDPDRNNTVFTSILEEDILGFDSNNYDFEMLVLENGHGTDTATTTYNFYVELE